MSAPSRLDGACVWQGAEMARSDRWVKPLPAAVLAQLDAAVGKTAALDWRRVNRDNFPLPGADAFLGELREELENGSGMVQLRGLDVRRYDETELRRLWLGIGCHLGTLLYQNRRGEVMRDIRDEGAAGASLYGVTVDAAGKTFLSSGARTLSSGQLRFHTDRCDVVGLLCVRQAPEA